MCFTNNWLTSLCPKFLCFKSLVFKGGQGGLGGLGGHGGHGGQGGHGQWWSWAGKKGQTWKTKLTFLVDIPGDLCRAAFAILAMFVCFESFYEWLKFKLWLHSKLPQGAALVLLGHSCICLNQAFSRQDPQLRLPTLSQRRGCERGEEELERSGRPPSYCPGRLHLG